MLRPLVAAITTVLLVAASTRSAASDGPFQLRGYYMTFMRMPTFGLKEWKEMIDCVQQDRGNTLLLWTAGAFRSQRFPVTWQYNREHKNVEKDFVRELIDYAHGKQIKVLLCFTPFAYDGVNQFPLERLREIEQRYRNATAPAEREMRRISSAMVQKWNAAGLPVH